MIDPFLSKKTNPFSKNKGLKFKLSISLNFENLKLPTFSNIPKYFKEPKLF